MKKYKTILTTLLLGLVLLPLSACNNKGQELVRLDSSLSNEEKARVLSAREEIKVDDLFEEENVNTRAKIKNKITISDDLYVMDEFPEVSNIASYVDNQIGGIKLFADNVIANVNREDNINVGNIWLKKEHFNESIYFTSSQENVSLYSQEVRKSNSFSLSSVDSFKDGRKEIENYNFNDVSKFRISTVENEVYEHYEDFNDYKTYISYDNSLGYWQFLSASFFMNQSPTFSSFAFCENLNYEVVYIKDTDSDKMELYSIKIVSNNSSYDIMSYTKGNITLYLSGFEGVDRIEKELVDGNYNENNIDIGGVDVFFDNGKKIEVGDSLLDGKMVYLNGYGVEPSVQDHTTPGLEFTFTQEDLDLKSRFKILDQFLEEYGIRCKTNMSVIMDEISKIQFKAEHLVDTYKWNECNLSSSSSILQAFELEDEKLENIRSEFEKIKNKPDASYDKVDNSYVYAQLVNLDANVGNLTMDKQSIKVNNLNLNLSETNLLENNKQYKVNFALAKSDKNIISHVLPLKNDSTLTYNGNNNFTISNEFTFPDRLDSDDYKLIVYLSTLNDVRVSQKIALSYDIENVVKTNRNIIKVTKGSPLTISYQINEEQVINPTKSSYTYSELVEELAITAYQSDYEPSLVLEMENGSTYKVVSEGSKIDNGKYRMAFKNYETNKGYIYITINN